MLKIFSLYTKQSLVEETSLSRFVHSASSAEKKRIYNRVIQQASEEQRAMLHTFQERRSSEKNVHA